MKIIVTGGAGFVGSHIVDAYVTAGHQVVVVDDLSTGRRRNVHPGARLVEMDINDPGLVKLFETNLYRCVFSTCLWRVAGLGNP